MTSALTISMFHAISHGHFIFPFVLLNLVFYTSDFSKDDGITLWRETFKKVLGQVRHMPRFVYIKQTVYDGKSFRGIFRGFSLFLRKPFSDCFWVIKNKNVQLLLKSEQNIKTKDEVSFPKIYFFPVMLLITAKNWLV